MVWAIAGAFVVAVAVTVAGAGAGAGAAVFNGTVVVVVVVATGPLEVAWAWRRAMRRASVVSTAKACWATRSGSRSERYGNVAAALLVGHQGGAATGGGGDRSSEVDEADESGARWGMDGGIGTGSGHVPYS